MRRKVKMKDKKNFYHPQLYNCNNDIRKRWYVFYYAPLHNGYSSTRIKIYGGINWIKTVGERKKYAEKIIKELLFVRDPFRIEIFAT